MVITERYHFDTKEEPGDKIVNTYISNSGDRRQYRQDRGRPRYEQNYRRGNLRGNMRSFDRKNSRVEYRTITEMTVMIEAGTGPEKGHFPETITTIEIGVQAIVGLGQDQEHIQIETE